MNEEVPYLLVTDIVEAKVIWSPVVPEYTGTTINLSTGKVINPLDTDLDAVFRNNIELVSAEINKLSIKRASKLLPV